MQDLVPPLSFYRITLSLHGISPPEPCQPPFCWAVWGLESPGDPGLPLLPSVPQGWAPREAQGTSKAKCVSSQAGVARLPFWEGVVGGAPSQSGKAARKSREARRICMGLPPKKGWLAAPAGSTGGEGRGHVRCSGRNTGLAFEGGMGLSPAKKGEQGRGFPGQGTHK